MCMTKFGVCPQHVALNEDKKYRIANWQHVAISKISTQATEDNLLSHPWEEEFMRSYH